MQNGFFSPTAKEWGKQVQAFGRCGKTHFLELPRFEPAGSETHEACANMATDQASGGARHTRNMGVLPATPSGGGGVGNQKNLAIKHAVLKIAERHDQARNELALVAALTETPFIPTRNAVRMAAHCGVTTQREGRIGSRHAEPRALANTNGFQGGADLLLSGLAMLDAGEIKDYRFVEDVCD